MRILIYGIGHYSDAIEGSLRKDHTIIGYTDSFSKMKVYKGKPFYRVEDLAQASYDYIVITVYNREILVKICDKLEKEYYIEKEKIIPYFLWINNEKWQNKLRKSEPDIQGIVLGNSHAFYAFQTDFFSVPFINLSCPSQDVYFNYRVLNAALKKYMEKLRFLKYVVIDLYDYNNFNIDLSMGKNLFDYFSWGGCVAAHNFDKNKNYSISFGQQAYREKKLLVDVDKYKRPMEMLFGHNGNCIESNLEKNCWGHIGGDEPLPASVLLSTNVTQRYEGTIEENKSTFALMLQEIKSFKEDIKIIFTLVPRYCSMEKALKGTVDSIWKEDFMTFIQQMCREYNAAFISYKEEKTIFQNSQLYHDVCHLNTIGGRCVTSALDEELKKYR